MVFVKVLFASLLPFIILLFNTGYWILAGKYMHRKNSFNMLFFTSVIIQFFLQPTVLKELSNPLLCVKIDGEYFIKSAMDVSCQDSSYKSWVIFHYFLFFQIFYKFSIVLQTSQIFSKNFQFFRK